MIQCKECEFYHVSPTGEVAFACDPFTNVKEPSCLLKWQLVRLNHMAAAYQAMLDFNRKLAPLQEKMFKIMEREIEDLNESDKWKVDEKGEEEEDSDDDRWNCSGDYRLK